MNTNSIQKNFCGYYFVTVFENKKEINKRDKYEQTNIHYNEDLQNNGDLETTTFPIFKSMNLERPLPRGEIFVCHSKASKPPKPIITHGSIPSLEKLNKVFEHLKQDEVGANVIAIKGCGILQTLKMLELCKKPRTLKIDHIELKESFDLDKLELGKYSRHSLTSLKLEGIAWTLFGSFHPNMTEEINKSLFKLFSDNFPELTELKLKGIFIGDNGLENLSTSKNFKKVEILSLKNINITFSGLLKFLKKIDTTFPKLSVLDVRDNKLMGHEDIEKIPSESRRELSDIVKQKGLYLKIGFNS